MTRGTPAGQARPPAESRHAPPPRFFPWTSVPASGRFEFPAGFLIRHRREVLTWGDAHRALAAALGRAGYPGGTLFAVAGGFALVTPLERTDGAGRPWPERWVAPGRLLPGTFDLQTLTAVIGGAPPGDYRLLALVVAPWTRAHPWAAVRDADLTPWRGGGSLALPAAVAGAPITPEHRMTALSFEWSRGGRDQPARLRVPGRHGTRDHLEHSGLWRALTETKAPR